MLFLLTFSRSLFFFPPMLLSYLKCNLWLYNLFLVWEGKNSKEKKVMLICTSGVRQANMQPVRHLKYSSLQLWDVMAAPGTKVSPFPPVMSPWSCGKMEAFRPPSLGLSMINATAWVTQCQYVQIIIGAGKNVEWIFGFRLHTVVCLTISNFANFIVLQYIWWLIN